MRVLFKEWKMFLGEAKKEEWNSAHAVLIRGKKVLLLQRSKRDGWMPEKWGLPGGYIEKSETLESGLKREISEETGYNVELKNLAYLPEISYKVKHAFFVCKEFNGKLLLNANGIKEHEDAKWVELKEIEDLKTVPDIKEVVLEAFNMLGIQ